MADWELTTIITHKLNVVNASSTFDKPVKEFSPSCLVLHSEDHILNGIVSI